MSCRANQWRKPLRLPSVDTAKPGLTPPQRILEGKTARLDGTLLMLLSLEERLDGGMGLGLDDHHPPRVIYIQQRV